MAGIRVITDGASDLPAASCRALGIDVVPLEVRIGAIGPERTRAMSAEEFWHLCAESSDLPETSAPSPGDFQRAFLEARDAGCEGAVCITLSAELSATYQAAAAAANIGPEFPVEVIDSRTVTMAQGLIVLEAADLTRSGGDLDAVARVARAAIDKVVAIGALDTLDNLRRGGRIGSAQAFFGSLLSLKPIIVIRNGIVEGESRQRTRRRSLEYIADKVAELAPFRRLAVVHAAASDVEVLVDLVSRFHLREEILVSHIGPVVGSHTGPGTVAICALRA